MSEQQHVTDHLNHRIDLTPEFVFEVSGEAFSMEMPTKFQSLQMAKEAIDERVAAFAKERKAQLSLSLPALTDTGADFVIRGINSVSSRILGIETKGHSDPTLYVPSEAVRALLKERMVLRKRAGEIEAKLKTARVETRRGYGNISVLKYEEAIEALKAEYDRAAQGAITVKVD